MNEPYETPVNTRLEQAKKPVNSFLAGSYGHPYHPIFVTIPIGAWVASLVFDIASHLAPGASFLVQGSEWLIAIGMIGALAAAGTGFLDLLAIPKDTSVFRTALTHMALNVLVLGAYVINFIWRYGEYGHADNVGVGMIVLSAISLIILSISGYLGGKLAYHYGVRVANEATQAEGYDKG